MSLLKLQRGALSVVVGATTGHFIMGTHEKCIVLGHPDLCRICRDENEEENVPNLLGTYSGALRKEKKVLASLLYE